ncbi:unnamed protein product, partial [Rotaria magnacalcarata]
MCLSRSFLHIFVYSLIKYYFHYGKGVHTVQLLLAERMYKLYEMPQIFEFLGPPHPEDPL